MHFLRCLLSNHALPPSPAWSPTFAECLSAQVDAPAQAASASAAAAAGDAGDAGDNDGDAGYLSDSEIVQERRVKVASALDAEAAEKAREKICYKNLLSSPRIKCQMSLISHIFGKSHAF